MPCRDYDDFPTAPSTPSYSDRLLEDAQRRIKSQKKLLNDYARLLCFVMTHTDNNDFLITLAEAKGSDEHGKTPYNDLMKWWKKHKEDDAADAIKREEVKRVREERARDKKEKAELLASLTPKQKKLLGIS